MSSDEGQVNLSEICEDVSYGYTESATNDPVGPKFLRITDIQGGSFDWSKVPYCPASDENIKKYRLEIGDILIARTGNSTGENAQVITEPPAAVFASYLIRFRPDSSRVNPFFVGYQLRSEKFRQHVLAVRGGSAQPGANAKQLGAFPVQLIARERQDAAVEILRSLDDRISLMRETNVTLEAIAQALFKSWFVDFDPVRAKMEGRAPEDMDEANAALFPDSFEESELGLVPRGWRIGTLADVAHLQKSSVNPLHQPDVLFEHYSLPAFDDGQSPIIEAGIEIKSNKTVVPANAVLLSKLNPHIPRVWLPTDAGINAVCSTEFLAFIPADTVSREFIYCIFTSERFLQSLCQLVTGTSNSHQRVKPDGVLSMNSVIPPADVMVSFATITKPIFDRIGHNRQQAQTFANLRDTLLPRLISGQLRLSEVDSLR